MDMDLDYELESLRRSIAMLSPGSRALDREQALRVLADLQAAQRERDELREQLAKRGPVRPRVVSLGGAAAPRTPGRRCSHGWSAT